MPHTATRYTHARAPGRTRSLTAPIAAAALLAAVRHAGHAQMLNRSLATFMNAFTASDVTMYPFSTTNAQDYSNLLSVYPTPPSSRCSSGSTFCKKGGGSSTPTRGHDHPRRAQGRRLQ